MRTRTIWNASLALALILTAALSPGQVAPTLAAPAPTGGQSQSIESGQTPEGLSGAEWDSIRAQIAAGKYRAYTGADGGYVSSNPAHGWRIAYGADGRTALTPRGQGGDWSWGLQLTGYGYGAARTRPDQPTRLTAGDHTLTYHWDANLSEWWTNTSAGLEQGFSL